MSPKNEFISEARSVSFKDQARSEEDLVYFIQKNGKSGKEASASQFGKHREKRCVAKKEGLIPWECPISQSQFQFPFKKQYQNELFLGRNPSFSLLVLYLTRAEKTTQNKKKSIFKRFSYRLLSREQTAIVRLSILFFMAGLETSEEDHHLYPDRTPLLSVEWTGRRPKQSNKQERASDDKGCDFLIRENLPAEDLLERKQDDLKKSWVPARAETGQAGIELDDAFKG
ncbi:hypothetical protein IEQ34_023714 [Dendrobium chrysotoxum]|uniref:Uncharacterized protein n=1 Tax=Dendrobium chrysotoxum TaxID=161865 RepID=A0AAV7FTU0_DENCH|nr:hypothetical protein IEQ34_023714 [Dendrobium chrysotoxum]